MEEKTINFGEVYRRLKAIEQSMVTKKELNMALESVMILSNEDTVKQLVESENDIKAGKVKKINSTRDL